MLKKETGTIRCDELLRKNSPPSYACQQWQSDESRKGTSVRLQNNEITDEDRLERLENETRGWVNTIPYNTIRVEVRQEIVSAFVDLPETMERFEISLVMWSRAEVSTSTRQVKLASSEASQSQKTQGLYKAQTAVACIVTPGTGQAIMAIRKI